MVIVLVVLVCCFFFASRSRHTSFDCDWSSDVCSSDLALVLTPPRELAAQVAESARDYGRHTGLRTVVIFGGVSEKPQIRSEEHTSELQSQSNLVCRLLLEKKKKMLRPWPIYDRYRSSETPLVYQATEVC